MFSLLVSGIKGSWETDQLMRMDASRFGHGNGVEGEAISADEPDTLKALEQTQALLMYERGLPTSGIVRYGHLRDVRFVQPSLVFRFLEHGRLARQVVVEFATRLGIEDHWEFGRTHWALKDGDIPSGVLEELQPTFEVFLSYNNDDAHVARQLKERLACAGLSAWLADDELRPGLPWQHLLETGIEKSAAVAVLIGSDGIGPWESEEMQAALRLAVNDKRPVIPVLLPGAPPEPKLPAFLGIRTWVDLRSGLDDEPMRRLIWGIKGVKTAT